MDLICPECQTGKHQNCDGVAAIGDISEPLPCACTVGTHPIRKSNIYNSSGLVGLVAPPNDPGVLAAAFPELGFEEDWITPYRLKPDKEIITDLLDVEIQNKEGVWVPAVPLPHFSWFGIRKCHCGKRRLGLKRYQEHYAYAHILGMD